jgi:hypothetical protein
MAKVLAVAARVLDVGPGPLAADDGGARLPVPSVGVRHLRKCGLPGSTPPQQDKFGALISLLKETRGQFFSKRILHSC